ncbi:hypothetical protein PPERSA_03574 [Pseudocohnilembus persalinus]|uniref:Tetratricopeptide repeat protein n=1 Tax=Pseudocohnilembus persalinus TaxID=266149 RepID=A0A0V0QPS8_PSEPJ|nr:hypothetical protein PPERSA_03574 [Pseudocohnilembus persalinus]|eukprot:KRX04334.1 hypothetical protein PPERSA_03574 [Pseudocohnilembus persalinus]
MSVIYETMWNLAGIYLQQNNFKDALKYFTKMRQKFYQEQHDIPKFVKQLSIDKTNSNKQVNNENQIKLDNSNNNEVINIENIENFQNYADQYIDTEELAQLIYLQAMCYKFLNNPKEATDHYLDALELYNNINENHPKIEKIYLVLENLKQQGP